MFTGRHRCRLAGFQSADRFQASIYGEAREIVIPGCGKPTIIRSLPRLQADTVLSRHHALTAGNGRGLQNLAKFLPITAIGAF